jgi:hypothetical protein
MMEVLMEDGDVARDFIKAGIAAVLIISTPIIGSMIADHYTLKKHPELRRVPTIEKKEPNIPCRPPVPHAPPLNL